MEEFAKDIYGFLESCGLYIYKVRSGYGFESISVSDASGQDAHPVLLVGIVADSLEKASVQQTAASEEISIVRCETGRYPLIVTEDRWKRQNDAMRLRILSHLKIFTQVYARNCEIRRIDKATAEAFLAQNHSYADAACRYRYGLYLKRHTGHNALPEAEGPSPHTAGPAATSTTSSPAATGNLPAPGTLVAVATFSNARKWIKGDKTIRSYEWTRYASLPGIRLNGGMGKILKTFIKEVSPDDIMTYADLEWSEGKVYEQLGFSLEDTRPAVTFNIDTAGRRSPITSAITATTPAMASPATTGNLYFRNFGSNKYRIKLTDYH